MPFWHWVPDLPQNCIKQDRRPTVPGPDHGNYRKYWEASLIVNLSKTCQKLLDRSPISLIRMKAQAQLSVNTFNILFDHLGLVKLRYNSNNDRLGHKG